MRLLMLSLCGCRSIQTGSGKLQSSTMAGRIPRSYASLSESSKDIAMKQHTSSDSSFRFTVPYFLSLTVRRRNVPADTLFRTERDVKDPDWANRPRFLHSEVPRTP